MEWQRYHQMKSMSFSDDLNAVHPIFWIFTCVSHVWNIDIFHGGHDISYIFFISPWSDTWHCKADMAHLTVDMYLSVLICMIRENCPRIVPPYRALVSCPRIVPSIRAKCLRIVPSYHAPVSCPRIVPPYRALIREKCPLNPFAIHWSSTQLIRHARTLYFPNSMEYINYYMVFTYQPSYRALYSRISPRPLPYHPSLRSGWYVEVSGWYVSLEARYEGRYVKNHVITYKSQMSECKKFITNWLNGRERTTLQKGNCLLED